MELDPRRDEALARDLRAVAESIGLRLARGGRLAWCPLGHSRGPGRGTASLSFFRRAGREGWRCHGCGAGGDVIDLVRAVTGCDYRGALDRLAGWRPDPSRRVEYAAIEEQPDIPLETRARACSAFVAALPPLDPFGSAWLRDERAIALETAERWGLRSVDEQSGALAMEAAIEAVGVEVCAALGLARESQRRPGTVYSPQGAGGYRLALPYRAEGGAIQHLQFRRVSRSGEQPRGPKYEHLAGGVPIPYYAEPERAERVWIVEGALDALALWQAGQGAVGLPGARWLSEDRASRLAVALGRRSWIVALDADKAGRAAQAALLAQERAAGRSPLEAVWPEGWSGDWCEYLGAGRSLDEIRVVEAAAVPEPTEQREAAPAILSRGDDAEIGHLLLAEIGDLVVADEDSLWTWGGTSWQQRTDAECRNLVAGYAGRWVSTGAGRRPKPLLVSQGQCRRAVERAKDLADRPGWLADAPPGVPFRRGFLRLAADGAVTWQAHAPEHRQRESSILDIDPEPPSGDTDSAWGRFLLDTWQGCDDLDARAALLQEWMGAALFGIAARFKLALLLTGQADTGKSTLLAVVEALFPRRAVTHIGLQSMASEYYRAALAGARLNVVNELPERELLDVDAAKAILSADPVAARHPAGRPFSLVSRAAHVFAANELPRALDRALVRRLAVLDCPNARAAARQDQTLRARLLAELPLISWWAIEGAQRLVRRGHYELPMGSGDRAREWIEDSDSAAAFAADMLVRTEAGGDSSSMSAVYAAYRRWCEETGHRPVGDRELGKRLRQHGFVAGQRTGRGRTVCAAILGGTA